MCGTSNHVRTRQGREMIEYGFKAKYMVERKVQVNLLPRSPPHQTGTHFFTWAPEGKLVKSSVHVSGRTPLKSLSTGKDFLESLFQNQTQGVSDTSRNVGTAAPAFLSAFTLSLCGSTPCHTCMEVRGPLVRAGSPFTRLGNKCLWSQVKPELVLNQFKALNP